MRFLSTLVLCSVVLTTHADEASACGGVFASEQTILEATGHRMILSVSQKQTTLWDQVEYSGDPKSFAWVLPIKGKVAVGVSSDLLFEKLEEITQVTLSFPGLQCPAPQCDTTAATAGASGGGVDTPTPGVTLLASQVVGPYETVQLSAKDAGSLEAWLATNGYVVPADIAPVVAAYLADGFDFLAMKLVPGAGVSAMRPVRVTTPGMSPVLPLRMVAAGAGGVMSVTLWVLADGRYETANQPSFQVNQSALIWDYDSMTSNYEAVTRQEFAAKNDAAWLIEAGEAISGETVSAPLLDAARQTPQQSGYGGGDVGIGGLGGAGGTGGDAGNTALSEAQADMDALLVGQDSLWISRLHGELSREALATDLEVGAALDQTPVARTFVLSNVNGLPMCPSNVCGDPTDEALAYAESDTGCALAQGDRRSQGENHLPAWLGLGAAIALTSRRRRPR